jgi:Xaa-Pro aminopeptidase
VTTLSPVSGVERLQTVQAAIAAAGLDAVLLTHLPNIRYLTGFTGSSALLLIARSEVRLGTDGRYRERAQAEAAAAGLELNGFVIGPPAEQQLRLVADLVPRGRIGLEADHIAWGEASSLTSGALQAFDVVATNALVESVRLRKDSTELERMRHAAAIASRSLNDTLAEGLVGKTERDLAIAIEQRMVKFGASGPSFSTIVASGPNAASPHAVPGDRVVTEGDLVVFDLGSRVDGYCSDMTRTVPAGTPSNELLDALELVTCAQQAGVDALGPGVRTSAIDAACRDHLDAAGFGDFFVHGTGHGVGLDIHEDPFVGKTTTGILEEGMVVTVEPGVYLPGRYGVRVEDMLLITSAGAENLTPHPKFGRETVLS